MSDKVPSLTVAVPYAFPLQRLSDLLCTALEGGSNYWYTITEFIEPAELTFQERPGEVCRHLEYPLNPGGALLVADKHDMEAGSHRLDLESIRRGLAVMAEKYPRHFAEFQREQDDANTGDIFLQCCLFGSVVFG